jgi:predicted O-methyltransferase YrrM
MICRASQILYNYATKSVRELADELDGYRSCHQGDGRSPDFIFIDARVAHILDILHSIEKLEKP